MSNLPIRYGDLPGQSRQVVKAVQAQEKVELAIHSHFLETEYLRQCDAIDSAAIADVVKAALDEEMHVLDAGLAAATGSPAKAELVSRLVSMQSKIDSARIARRFGG